MVSVTVHRTWKQRWLPLVARIIGSLLPIIASFMGLFTLPSAYGAGLDQNRDPGLGQGIDMMIKVKKSDMPGPQVNLVVFFTRPAPCAQNSDNCNGKIETYAPNDKMSCSSPIPQAQKSSSANPSWVSNGEECPYLNCNWSNVPEGCSANTSETVFRQAPPELSALGDSYMMQPLDYTKLSSVYDSYGFSGCIYYGNWPHFSRKNFVFVTSGSNNIELAPKTQPSTDTPPTDTLPDGITLQKIQTALASSKQTLAKGTNAGTGWDMQQTA